MRLCRNVINLSWKIKDRQLVSQNLRTPKEEEHSLACWDQSRHLVGFGIMSAFLKLFQNAKTLDVKNMPWHMVCAIVVSCGLYWT